MTKIEKFSLDKERLRAFMLGRKYFKGVEALYFGESYHKGFRKDNVTPEYHHQISIAHVIRTLPDLRYPEESLIAALLHDTVEDHDVSIDVIENKFGKNSSIAVECLTKKFRGEIKDNKEYYKAIGNNPIASIVKACDRMHNFQTMPNVFSLEKQKSYIKECETFLLPMIRSARNLYPDQELAYENVKYSLISQIELINLIIQNRE